MPAKRIENLDRNFQAQGLTQQSTALLWLLHSDRRFTIRGLAWFKENKGSFSRLPHRAQKLVREPVWELAQCPASARICFRSDTTTLAVRVKNDDAGHMMHMPSSGSNGCILYCGEPGQMRPWASAIPESEGGSFERELFTGVPKKMREFVLYLPSYKALRSLEIGLSSGAKIEKPSAPALSKPVVFYGTSITQGGCANTAGTDFVSTLGRNLNLDVINLGFSGNGKGEPELAQLVSEIDASLYVLDYAGNVNAQQLKETLPPFVKILRQKRPKTPILIVTNVCFSTYDWRDSTRDELEQRRDVMMEFYLRTRESGDRNIHLADGFSLIPFGTDGAYVDGVHPTDHGFALMAERLAPAIRMILQRDH